MDLRELAPPLRALTSRAGGTRVQSLPLRPPSGIEPWFLRRARRRDRVRSTLSLLRASLNNPGGFLSLVTLELAPPQRPRVRETRCASVLT